MNNPEKQLIAQQMQKQLGNCKKCQHVNDDLNGCVKKNVNFNVRFSIDSCNQHEFNRDWLN